MEVLEIVERVGAYAGFAAVVGLAVLSALYFSQARDVRRLREWAGRAPERVASGPAVPRTTSAATAAPSARSAAGATAATSRSAAATGAPTRAGAPPASTPAGAAAPPTGEGVTAAAAGAQAGAPESPSAGGTPTATESPASGVPWSPGNGTGAASPPPVRPIGPVVSSRTQSIPRPAPQNPPEEGRRLAPRLVALLLAGVLILGAGIAYAVVRGSEPDVAPPMARQGPAPLVPGEVTVSVLNGTTVPGLAARIGDRVESAGFRLGNVTNASEQQRAESVILYRPGADREARIVGRRLRIEQTERADASDRVLAGTAKVVVMVGADQMP
jgi:hypothetical protein